MKYVRSKMRRVVEVMLVILVVVEGDDQDVALILS